MILRSWNWPFMLIYIAFLWRNLKKKITSLICFYKQKFAKTRSPFISLTTTKLIQRLGLIFHSPPSYYVTSPSLSYSKEFPHILPKLLLSDLFLFSRNYLKSPPTLVLLDTSLLSCWGHAPAHFSLPVSLFSICACLKSNSLRIMSA